MSAQQVNAQRADPQRTSGPPRSWLVTGAHGMLGRELVGLLREAGEPVTGVDRDEVDLRDPAACARAVRDVDVVVNCAAWTAVDDAEEQEAAAFAVNATGVANVARAASAAGARLVQLSTDYVFGGQAAGPHGEDDPPFPLSAYGRTKLAGEWAAAALCADSLVVRTAWLYGDGPCFPRTIARLLAQRDAIDVVDDQVGAPTWSRDLAGALVALVEAGAPAGRYHVTAGGSTSWYGFAVEVARTLGLDPGRVRPTTTDRFPRPAARPADSVLAGGALVAAAVAALPAWDERWAAAGTAVLGEPAPPGRTAGRAGDGA